MSMACTICNHPKRIEIDRELVQGISHQKIANKYGVDSQAVWRHSQNHLSRQLVTAMAKKELTESMDLLSRIEDILAKAKNIFDRNYEKGKDGLALKALSEQRSTIELLAKIAAFLHESRAMELQTNQQDEDKEQSQEYQKGLEALTMDELFILQSLSKKMRSGDKDRRVQIPYSYIGRRERKQDKEEYTTTVEELDTPSEATPEPKMTRTQKLNPLAIKVDDASPGNKPSCPSQNRRTLQRKLRDQEADRQPIIL